MDPMMIAKLLMGAGNGDPNALSTLDLSNAPTPDSPDFMNLLNPQGNNAGMALLGEGGPPDPQGMMSTNMQYPPGMGPSPVTPPGAPQPPPQPPMAGPPNQSPVPATPPEQPPGGNMAAALSGIGQQLGQAPKPVFSGGVSGTPKGMADTVHKAPAGSPMQMLLAALMGGRGRGTQGTGGSFGG